MSWRKTTRKLNPAPTSPVSNLNSKLVMTNTPITVHKAKEGLPAVTRVVVEREAVEPTFKIEMGLHDARVLRLIISVIGGSPDGLRGTASRLDEALYRAGIKEYGVEGTDYIYDVVEKTMHTSNCGIIFKDII